MKKLVGKKMHAFGKKIWAINRSLTGKGVRKTLFHIKKIIPKIKIKKVPSGKKVFDWRVPNEWNCKDAYLINPQGKKICKFKKCNLHLVGYSVAINKKISYTDLQKHLHSIPELPEAVPFVTSYYKPYWGFCLSHKEREKLISGIYRAVIKSNTKKGVLNYGELLIKGKTENEILFSTYICHPSLANNEISGIVLLTWLAKWLCSKKSLQNTYRIIFIPETIGSLVYIHQNLHHLKKFTKAGFIVTCVGDNRQYSFLPSRNANTYSDKIAKHILHWTDDKFVEYSWAQRGSDERQFCAPHVDLPIATISRSLYGQYPEYHTSLDNLETVVTPEGLKTSFQLYQKLINALEKNYYPVSKIIGEPFLSKRKLYSNLSKRSATLEAMRILDICTYADGKTSLLDIAEKIKCPIWELYKIVTRLKKEKIIS